MDDRDLLTAFFPAPDEDEPAYLRDDIVDELADHLACAYRREILRGTDEETARRRARFRFGDPGAIARQLWFDAMKGRIMTRGAILISSVAAAIVCVSLLGVLWAQSNRAQHQAIEALRASLEASNAAQKDFQQQLLELTRKQADAAVPSWIPIKLKLVEGSPEGPPVVGVEAIFGRDGGEHVRRISDENGVIDFGFVQPGDWSFMLGNRKWQAGGKLILKPGMSIDEVCVYPPSNVPAAPVTIELETPEGLDSRELVTVISLGHDRPIESKLNWMPASTPAGFIGVGAILKSESVVPINRMLKMPYSWSLDSESSLASPDQNLTSDTVVRISYLDFPGQGINQNPSAIELPVGQYRLEWMTIAQKVKEPHDDFSGVRGRVLVTHGDCRFISEAHPCSKSPNDSAASELSKDAERRWDLEYPSRASSALESAMQNNTTFSDVSITPHEAQQTVQGAYEVRQGQENHWVLKIPDRVVTELREALKKSPGA